MCGIAGYIGSAHIDDARVRECLALMRRRGPDAAGYRTLPAPGGRHVHLLHSRLSIIDLDERAHQPFQSGSRSLIFNGEIYNYVEVRRALADKGVTFRTESDTEVLIEAIGRDGLDSLDRLEGMWAFALYDEKTGALSLGRDRFGEKPLFIMRDATGIYFGSESKFISALAGRRLEIDVDHLSRYMVNGYKALYKGRQTFFRGLSELQPGKTLTVDAAGRESTSTYWRPRHAPDESMSFEAAVRGARERLIESVRLRLRADVPLAFCMSGGIDSNSLISIAKRVFNYDVHGFTIANTDSRYEEQDMVRHAVSELGIRHTEIPVQSLEFLPRLRTLVRQHDAPVYTITYFAHWLLMESISQGGYKISISGTAADEMFTGYFDHHLAYLEAVKGDAALHAASRAGWEKLVKPVVRNPHLGNPDLFVNDPSFRGHIYLNADEFSGYLHSGWSEPFSEERYTDALLRNRMMNEMFHEIVPVILHEDDLNAMFYSIENRSPFLDRALYEFCGTIPTRHLVREGRAKAVLREAMRGIVPDKILDNPRKVGFNAPIFSFLDVNDPSVRGWLLDDSPIFDIVRRDRIEDLVRRASLPNSESKFLFYFINSKMFIEEFGS